MMKVMLLAIVLISLQYGECLSPKSEVSLRLKVKYFERVYLQCYKQVPFFYFAKEYSSPDPLRDDPNFYEKAKCITKVFAQFTEKEQEDFDDSFPFQVDKILQDCFTKATLRRNAANLPYPLGFEEFKRCALEA
ncbi:unnamed protein product [Callosobruchus maculatus]|uniref:Uncharacterized protein n=1 Tax=Callosobruchus maculatus TaxID=64391 RepID=A0A653CRU9_CALMS|nr:unnamed protein product [Callosobruchus maculatus]